MHQAGSRRRTPGGLLLPMRAALKGRIRWQVLDERGVPEVPRSPSGLPLGPVEGIEQSNLITDLGMDQIAQYDCLSSSTTATGSPWRRYMAVGTGSTAPSNADTALDAEVQRAASSGSFDDGSETTILDGDNDLLIHENLVTRLVTMTADRNLTEVGFSPVSSDGVGIRELLRDAEGNPITVSLLNGKSLRVDHTLMLIFDAPKTGHVGTLDIEEYDAGNNLVGSTEYDIVYGPYAGGSLPISSGGRYMAAVWNPQNTGGQTTGAKTSSWTFDRDSGNTPMSGNTAPSLDTYTPGSHQRIKYTTFNTAAANGAWYGYLCVANIPGFGFGVQFVNPATYTKQSTDTLRVGMRSTWVRAGS